MACLGSDGPKDLFSVAADGTRRGSKVEQPRRQAGSVAGVVNIG